MQATFRIKLLACKTQVKDKPVAVLVRVFCGGHLSKPRVVPFPDDGAVLVDDGSGGVELVAVDVVALFLFYDRNRGVL